MVPVRPSIPAGDKGSRVLTEWEKIIVKNSYVFGLATTIEERNTNLTNIPELRGPVIEKAIDFNCEIVACHMTMKE